MNPFRRARRIDKKNTGHVDRVSGKVTRGKEQGALEYSHRMCGSFAAVARERLRRWPSVMVVRPYFRTDTRFLCNSGLMLDSGVLVRKGEFVQHDSTHVVDTVCVLLELAPECSLDITRRGVDRAPFEA